MHVQQFMKPELRRSFPNRRISLYWRIQRAMSHAVYSAIYTNQGGLIECPSYYFVYISI